MDVSPETVGVGMMSFGEMVTSFRLGLTRVQQPVWSDWRIQDGGQLLSKNVPRVTLNFFWWWGGGVFSRKSIYLGTKNFRGKGRLLSESAVTFCIRPT